MKLDWSDLRFFLAVAQTKSIAAAAKALKVNHSTVLRRIDQMEKTLDVTLFVRGKGSCALTEEGNSVFIAAKRMAEHAQDLERHFGTIRSEEIAGHIAISAADFVIARWLMPGLESFTREYPGLTVSLTATNGFLNLSQREADIIIRLTDNPKQHLPLGLHGKKIGDVALCAYKGARSASKNLKWIAWDAAVDFDRWVERNGYPKFPRGAVVDSPLLQLEGVKSGDFAAILPCFLGDADAGATRIKGCRPFKGFEAWLLTHPDLRSIRRVSVAMQYLSGLLAGKLGAESAKAPA